MDSIPSLDHQIRQVVFPGTTLPKWQQEINHGEIILRRSNESQSPLEVGIIVKNRIQKHESKGKQALIYSHGNAENIFFVQPYLEYLAEQFNFITISYDYPGYGLSTGVANEQTCVESLKVTIDFVLTELDVGVQDIFLLGRSLGTGVIIDFAFKYDWRSPIILISPYKSVPRVLVDFPILDKLVKKYRFQSIEKISELRCPIRIFHGLRDTVIPISHAVALYQKILHKSYVLTPVWIPDADHHNILVKMKPRDLLEVFKCSSAPSL